MAIPGYVGEIDSYDNGELIWYTSKLVGLIGMFESDVKRVLDELREFVIDEGRFTNIINTDGSIDLSKLTSPTFEMLRSSEIKIYGVPGDMPVYFGWENGVRTLIYGEGARPYIRMASLPNEQYLIAPTLVLLSSSGIQATSSTGAGGTLQTVSFGASFMTVYGETDMSNLIQIGPMLSWQSVTLGVVTENIPSYATSVKYYKDFNGTFRLVSEVKL